MGTGAAFWITITQTRQVWNTWATQLFLRQCSPRFDLTDDALGGRMGRGKALWSTVSQAGQAGGQVRNTQSGNSQSWDISRPSLMVSCHLSGCDTVKSDLVNHKDDSDQLWHPLLYSYSYQAVLYGMNVPYLDSSELLCTRKQIGTCGMGSLRLLNQIVQTQFWPFLALACSRVP